MPRDDFSEPVKRLLAERAAYKCSNPDCNRVTIGASLENPDKSIKPGVAAHIYAASKLGPRYDEKQTKEERTSASNGIWLCSTCASLIDKNNGIDFPVPLLRVWKENHELQTFQELSTGISESGLTGWCEEDSGKWKLYAKNSASVPFYDLVVYGFKLERCNEMFADIELVFGTIPPRQTLSGDADYEVLKGVSFGFPMVELEYTDSEGKHWKRDRFGKVEEIEFRRPFD